MYPRVSSSKWLHHWREYSSRFSHSEYAFERLVILLNIHFSSLLLEEEVSSQYTYGPVTMSSFKVPKPATNSCHYRFLSSIPENSITSLIFNKEVVCYIERWRVLKDSGFDSEMDTLKLCLSHEPVTRAGLIGVGQIKN